MHRLQHIHFLYTQSVRIDCFRIKAIQQFVVAVVTFWLNLELLKHRLTDSQDLKFEPYVLMAEGLPAINTEGRYADFLFKIET